jgi:hypothetical protein
MRPRWWWLAVLLLAPACASPVKVNKQMLPYIESGDHTGALSVLSDAQKQYGDKNAVLYQLELGMLYHYAGRFEESNESFEIAKRLAELHYTKSITAEASTFLANDNTRPYYGENFERALIHVFAAINYQALGMKDEALVEVRQLNFFLRQLVVDDGQDNYYRDDAFAHYLAAIFYEEDGDLDEAWVAYQKALDAYAEFGEVYGVASPPSLRRDARRLTARLGVWAEDEFAERYGPELQLAHLEKGEGDGRVIVVHYNGRAPVKIDSFIDVAFAHGWPYVNQIDVDDEDAANVARASQIATSLLADDVVRVAFPEYRSVPHRIDHVEIQLEGSRQVVHAELVENVGAVARRDLADRIHRIRAKAIARATVKYALGKIAEEAAKEAGGNEYGDLARGLVAITSALVRTASEVSDKRGWFTVPDQIWMSQLYLPEGEHLLRLTYRDGLGGVVRQREVEVQVEAGGHRFVILRTVE